MNITTGRKICIFDFRMTCPFKRPLKQMAQIQFVVLSKRKSGFFFKFGKKHSDNNYSNLRIFIRLKTCLEGIFKLLSSDYSFCFIPLLPPYVHKCKLFSFFKPESFHYAAIQSPQFLFTVPVCCRVCRLTDQGTKAKSRYLNSF